MLSNKKWEFKNHLMKDGNVDENIIIVVFLTLLINHLMIVFI